GCGLGTCTAAHTLVYIPQRPCPGLVTSSSSHCVARYQQPSHIGLCNAFSRSLHISFRCCLARHLEVVFSLPHLASPRLHSRTRFASSCLAPRRALWLLLFHRQQFQQ